MISRTRASAALKSPDASVSEFGCSEAIWSASFPSYPKAAVPSGLITGCLYKAGKTNIDGLRNNAVTINHVGPSDCKRGLHSWQA